MHEATFHHEQVLTHDQVVDRFRSVSHIAVLPPDEQEAVIDEIRQRARHASDLRRAGARSRSPTGSTPTGASAGDVCLARGSRSTAGRAAGWASRVTGRGAGTQVSGPRDARHRARPARRRRRHADASRSSRPPTARPRPPGCSPRRCAPTGPRSRRTTPAPTCPPGSPPALAREPRHRRRDHRGRRAVAAQGRRPARRGAARPRQPHPRPARPLRRGARRSPSSGARSARRIPRSAVIANASDPHVVWAAEPAEPDLGRARRAVAQRRGHLPALRGAARPGPTTASTARAAASPSPRPRTGSTATRSCSTASASRCTCASRGLEPDERRARARGRGRCTSTCRSAAPSRGSRRSRWCRVASRPGASPTAATRGCCSRRTRPAGPRCCAGCRARDTRAWCSR